MTGLYFTNKWINFHLHHVRKISRLGSKEMGAIPYEFFLSDAGLRNSYNVKN